MASNDGGGGDAPPGASGGGDGAGPPAPPADPTAAELVALVAWLQTFAAFPHRIVSGTDGAVALGSVRDALDADTTAGSLWDVALELCWASEDGATDTDAPPPRRPAAADVWEAMAELAAPRARPLLPEYALDPAERLSAARYRILVLSALLDCAVNHPDHDRRRDYVQRIMRLTKPLQRAIMGIIERRVVKKDKKTPAKKTPAKDGTGRTPPRSTSRVHRASPSGANGTPRRSHDNSSDGGSSRRRPPAGPRPWASPAGGDAGTPLTTPRRRVWDGADLLSPGLLDSPTAIRAAMEELVAQNKLLERDLAAIRSHATLLQGELDAARLQHRQQMVSLEATQRVEAEEMRTELEGRIAALEAELERLRDLAAAGEEALQELVRQRDELVELRQDRDKLEKAQETVRRLKAKLEELDDLRDNYQQEQDRHAATVQQCIDLRHEVAGLTAAKRQLDEYKTRAIEAELKLLQQQELLEQLQTESSEQSAKNQVLLQGAAMQQERIQEMQRRLEREAEELALASHGPGIGEGINEFNPEVVAELAHLRSENLRLQVFAAQRENDAVARLERSLEDAQMTADTLRKQLRIANETQASTQVSLNESRARETARTEEIEKVQQILQDLEKSRHMIQEQLTRCEQRLKLTQQELEEAEQRLSATQEEADHWQRRAKKAEHDSQELLKKWQNAQEDLEKTRHVLEDNGQTILALQGRLQTHQSRVKELEESEQSLHQLMKEKDLSLADITSQLNENINSLVERDSVVEELRSQLSNAKESIEHLQQEASTLSSQVEAEKLARLQTEEKAAASLVASQEALELEHKRKYDEMLGNMNCKLDDERRASRRKDEEHVRQLEESDNHWRTRYDSLAEQLATIGNSRDEAHRQIEALKQAHASEMERYNAEAEESRRLLIERGNRLMDEAKATAAQEVTALENRLHATRVEKDEVEALLRGKVHSYKMKLDQAERNNLGHLQEIDDLQTKLRNVDREMLKLQEDNDLYRRQLGGNYGGDGSIQAQMEKLQKEFASVVQENRNLKREARHAKDMASIAESESEEAGLYNRPGKCKDSFIKQLRCEYEEQIDALNNEKRELVMQASAAANDVRKAEQRAYEREKDLEKLKLELNELKLQISRMQIRNERVDPSENHPPAEEGSSLYERNSLFHSAHAGGTPQDKASGRRLRLHPSSRSPAIDRAFQNRDSQEINLRTKVAMFTGKQNDGTPPPRPQPRSTPSSRKSTGKVKDEPHTASSKGNENVILSPSKKHEHQANQQQPKHNQNRSDIFRRDKDESSKKLQHIENNLFDVTKWDQEKRASVMDEQPECNQS